VHFSVGVHRLHVSTAVINALSIVVIMFVLGGYSLLITQTADGFALLLTPKSLARFVLVMLPVTAVAALAGFWTWWSVKFRIDGDDLVVETGIMRRRSRRIPLSRIQAVDVVRPLVTRIFGLAEVRVELAGGDQAETKFRYLSRSMGEQLRAELLARAAGLPGQTPEAPERPYWRVGFGSLLGSQLLKLPVIGALTLFVALLAFGVVYREPGVLAAALPVLLGLARGVIAPLMMHGGFKAALSPDGLRLRYGLFETRMQTVPPGRDRAAAVAGVRLGAPRRHRRRVRRRTPGPVLGTPAGRAAAHRLPARRPGLPGHQRRGRAPAARAAVLARAVRRRRGGYRQRHLRHPARPDVPAARRDRPRAGAERTPDGGAVAAAAEARHRPRRRATRPGAGRRREPRAGRGAGDRGVRRRARAPGTRRRPANRPLGHLKETT
jgi:membrane protein YdbS with pleckstrin-like domain